MKLLSRADELVLLSVWRLQDNAYGVTIRRHLIETTGTDWSVGAVYDSLERMTVWEYLRTYQGDPTPERGGRRKRYFQLTREGLHALDRIKQVHQNMWENLPDPGFDTGL